MYAEEYESIRDPKIAKHVMAFAAGTRQDIPEYLVTNPQQTTEFLFAHRVSGRLLRALDRLNRPDLGEVREHAASVHQLAVTKYRFLEEKLAKFVKVFCHDMDVLVFKNHYYYAPGELSIRRTGDLDIAVSKPNVLQERLNASGLERQRERLPLHEFVNIGYEGADIDVHRYYPSWEVAPYVTHALERNGKCTLSTHRAHERGLSVAELIAGGMAVDVEGARVHVPSRTAAALITIAASHRDYVTQAAWYLKNHPPQRLSDLCEIVDALDDPSFSADELISQTRRQGLQDALRWFAGNLEEVLGDSRLSKLYGDAFGDARSTAIGDDWMLHLVAGGFWLPFTRNAVRDLSVLVPTSEVTEALGVPVMTLADGETRVLSLADPAVQEQIGVVLAGHVHLDNHRLEISRNGQELSFAFNAGTEIHIEYRSYFELNGECLEWDNLYTEGVEYLCGSKAAYKAMVSSAYDPATRTMRVRYRLADDQVDDELHTLVAVSAPVMPWETERGYMAVMRLRLT